MICRVWLLGSSGWGKGLDELDGLGREASRPYEGAIRELERSLWLKASEGAGREACCPYGGWLGWVMVGSCRFGDCPVHWALKQPSHPAGAPRNSGRTNRVALQEWHNAS